MASTTATTGRRGHLLGRSWRAECRRRDVVQVGRFEFERALRRGNVTVSAGAVGVLMVLASFGDRHGRNIFPSQETVARVCRRSVRHVRAKLREAVEAGLLRRLSHGGGRPGIRNGRRFRVTPARYELTLPVRLASDVIGATHPGHAPATTAEPSAFGPAAPASVGSGSLAAPRESSGLVLDDEALMVIREAVGVPWLSAQQARAAVGAALTRAPGRVRHPLRYAAEVIRRDPAFFRPVPDVVEPSCPHHLEHPATTCLRCAAATTGPTQAWRRARERLRRPDK